MKKIMKTLINRPLSLGSLIVLVLLYSGMLLAELIAPYLTNTTFQEHSYCPPSLIFYSKKLGFGPQVQRRVLIDEINHSYGRIKDEFYRVHLFPKGTPYKLFGLIPLDRHLFGTKVLYSDITGKEDLPGKTYPVFLLGSDNLGRDLFTRIIHGSRVSLTIGFIGIFITLFLSILLGGLAGYYGGIWDWIIMRIAEFFILIPGLYLILFLRSLLSKNLDSAQSYMIITMILSFVSWPGAARMIRGMIHSIKTEEFITNAKLEGIPSIIIIIRYIIPQMSSILIVSITLGIPGFILGETVLSFLALGIVEPAVSWGSLINYDVTSASNIQHFPWLIIPGFFLLITTLAFNFLGDLLRDLMDPYFKDRSVS